MDKTNKIISSFSPPSIYFSLIWCTLDTIDMIKSGIDDDYCKEDMLVDMSYFLSESKHAYYNSSFYNLNKISLQVVLKTLLKKYCTTTNTDYILVKRYSHCHQKSMSVKKMNIVSENGCLKLLKNLKNNINNL